MVKRISAYLIVLSAALLATAFLPFKAFAAGDAQTMMAFGGNGMFVSNDGGVTMTGKTTGITPFGWAVNGKGDILYAADASTGTVVKSTNYGNTWSTIASLGIYDPVVATSNDGNTVIVAGLNGIADQYHGKVFVSNDGGSSWNSISGVSGYGWKAISCNYDCSVAYITGMPNNFSGVIYKSTDKGQTWNSIAGTPPYVGISSSMDGNTVMYCVGGWGVGISVNWGSSFTEQTLTGAVFIRNMCGVSGDGKYAYASSYNGWAGGLYKSVIGSGIWTSIASYDASAGLSVNRSGDKVIVQSSTMSPSVKLYLNYGTSSTTLYAGFLNNSYNTAISKGTYTDTSNGWVGSFYYDHQGNACQSQQYLTESGTFTSIGFGNLSGSPGFTGAVVTDTTNNTIIGNFYANSGRDWDYFAAVNVSTDYFGGSTLSYSGFAWMNAGVQSVLRVTSGLSNIFGLVNASNSPLSLAFRSVRNGVVNGANYAKFAVDPTIPIGTQVANVVFIDDTRKDTEPLTVVSTGVALSTAQGDFVAKSIMTVKDLMQLSFSGFEMGIVTNRYQTVTTCNNQYWSCNVSYNPPTNGWSGFSCSQTWFDGWKQGTCGWSDATTCSPVTDPDVAPQVNPATGGTGTLWLSNSGSSIGSLGTTNASTIVIGTLPEAGASTGACSQMFSGSTFLYKGANSVMLISFSGSFLISDQRWECTLLGSNPCGTAYDAFSYILEKFLSILTDTTNFIMRPIKSAISYMGTPQKGKYYCFFGEKWQYAGKPSTYYSYLDKANVSVDGQTGFDYIIIAVLVIGLSVYVFKKW